MMRLTVPPTRAGKGLAFLARYLNLSKLEVAETGGRSVELLRGEGSSLRQPATVAKAMLSAASPSQLPLMGPSAAISAQASFWLNRAFSDSVSGQELLRSLNATLVSSSFAAGPVFTVADAVLLASLGDDVAAATKSGELFRLPEISRWVRATRPLAEAAALNPAALPPVPDVPSSAAPEEAVAAALAGLVSGAPPSAPAPVHPTDSAAPVAASSSSGAAASASASASAGKGGSAKGGAKAEAGGAKAAEGGAKAAKKKDKKKKEKKPAPAAEPEASPMSECDFRVGRIVKCWLHPDADKLFCEEIDCGEDSGPRQIASGLVGFYDDPAELNGKLCLVAFNLKPRPLAGFPSNGMVLCASTDGKGAVKILEPPEGAVPGERVVVAGHEGPAATPKRMAKKKILEAVFPLLKVDGDLRATYDGIPLMTSAGPVAISNAAFKGAQIA